MSHPICKMSDQKEDLKGHNLIIIFSTVWVTSFISAGDSRASMEGIWFRVTMMRYDKLTDAIMRNGVNSKGRNCCT